MATVLLSSSFLFSNPRMRTRWLSVFSVSPLPIFLCPYLCHSLFFLYSFPTPSECYNERVEYSSFLWLPPCTTTATFPLKSREPRRREHLIDDVIIFLRVFFYDHTHLFSEREDEVVSYLTAEQASIISEMSCMVHFKKRCVLETFLAHVSFWDDFCQD